MSKLIFNRIKQKWSLLPGSIEASSWDGAQKLLAGPLKAPAAPAKGRMRLEPEQWSEIVEWLEADPNTARAARRATQKFGFEVGRSLVWRRAQASGLPLRKQKKLAETPRNGDGPQPT